MNQIVILWKIIRETKICLTTLTRRHLKDFNVASKNFQFKTLYLHDYIFTFFFFCYCILITVVTIIIIITIIIIVIVILEQSLKKKRNKDFYQRIFKFYSYCSFLI